HFRISLPEVNKFHAVRHLCVSGKLHRITVSPFKCSKVLFPYPRKSEFSKINQLWNYSRIIIKLEENLATPKNKPERFLCPVSWRLNAYDKIRIKFRASRFFPIYWGHVVHTYCFLFYI